MMNIQLLRYAVEVDRCGSITRAAAKLSMGQPNLSKAIRDLEKEVGVSIFHRTARGVIATPEGEELLSYARQVVMQVEHIEMLYENEPKKHRRFCLSSTPSLYASEAFASFCCPVDGEDEQHMHLTLREINRLAVIDSVVSGASDAGMVRCRTDEETLLTNMALRRGLEVQPLWLYNMHVAMSKAHPLATEEHITEEMLAPYLRIRLENSPTERVYLFESELTAPNNITNSIVVTSRHSVESILMRLPAAYCSSPPVDTQRYARRGLLLRPVEGRVCQYRDFFLTRRGGMNAPLVKELLKHLYSMQMSGPSIE